MTILTPDSGFVRCLNGQEYRVCNWAVRCGGDSLCPACQLNRTIPNLQIAGNRISWARLESAKRRVVYTLNRLGLRPRNKTADPNGVVFDFLLPSPTQKVLTGHLHGVITLNLLEANDGFRENQRTILGEPHRTLAGHFRHEFGHYYWDRFFQGRRADDPTMLRLRELFGNEKMDYGGALRRLRERGPVAGWQASYISAYASCHPWEDWAESFAHFLHILDASETAMNFELESRKGQAFFQPFTRETITGGDQNPLPFLQILNDWSRLTPALNEMAASLGYADLYPSVLSTAVARKLYFISQVVYQAGRSFWPEVARRSNEFYSEQ